MSSDDRSGRAGLLDESESCRSICSGDRCDNSRCFSLSKWTLMTWPPISRPLNMATALPASFSVAKSAVPKPLGRPSGSVATLHKMCQGQWYQTICWHTHSALMMIPAGRNRSFSSCHCIDNGSLGDLATFSLSEPRTAYIGYKDNSIMQCAWWSHVRALMRQALHGYGHWRRYDDLGVRGGGRERVHEMAAAITRDTLIRRNKSLDACPH